MALKEDWKDTGKGLGEAFTDLGKTLIRTAEVGVDKARAWANDKDPKEAVPEENVTNDGSWRKTGKELGGAFADLGKTVVRTIETGADKVDEKVLGKSEEKKKEEKKAEEKSDDAEK